MKWQDHGIILSCRPWNDDYALVQVFTSQNGRHGGLLRINRKHNNQVQLGTIVDVTWQARLSEHLGRFQLEVTSTPWAKIMHQPDRLAALSCACQLIELCLPERHPYAEFYLTILDQIHDIVTAKAWIHSYLRFELNLLAVMGFGLEFNFCSVTRQQNDLVYISPKTGHAVCREVGQPYAERLLSLPQFLIHPSYNFTTDDLRQAFHLSGFFMHRHLFDNKPLPVIRDHLIQRLCHPSNHSVSVNE